MIRSDLIATFVLIVETGSLNVAATRLGLSRSVVSDRLKMLEADLGTLLVTRSTHGLSLTSAGEVFLEHARKLVSAMETARNAVAETGGSVSGPLRIAVPAALASRWLTPIFADFLEKHPLVTLELASSDRTVDIVQDGFDLAIRSARHRDSSLLARKLTSGRRIVVCSPSYRDRHGVPESLSQLSRHRFVVYRNRRVTQDWTFRSGKGVRSVRLGGRYEVDDGGAMAAAAVASIGICLLPTFLVNTDLAEGRLVRVDLGLEPDVDAISAVYPKANAGLPRLQALVSHLKAGIGDPPPWDSELIAAGILEV